MAVPVYVTGQVLAASDCNVWFLPLVAYKTSSTARTSTSLTIDPDLQFTLSAANAAYEIAAGIVHTIAAGVGFNFGWTLPAGTGGSITASFDLSGTGANTYGYSWSAPQLAGTGTGQGIIVSGLLTTGATTGTFGLNWASGTGASMSCAAGSYLIARRVG